MPIFEIKKQFETGKLSHNFFDAHVDYPLLMEMEWRTEAENRLGNFSKNMLTWIWTPQEKVTGFHQDPSYGGCGGWMRLSQGTKDWWLLADDDCKRLDLPVSKAHQMTPSMILDLARDQSVNIDLYYAQLNGGDLLWFPKNCIHRVETKAPSYGFGGYF